MIDSHCHLDREPIFNDLSNILIRSKKVGITKLLTICTTDSNFNTILELTKKDKIIYGTYGIHPHEVDKFYASKKHIINKIKIEDKIIGVGESGLDFFYNNSKKNAQIKSFESHIEASIELDVPIIVHSRNAESETFNSLTKFKTERPKILMHCFTGSSNFVDKLLDMNVYFSASGIITFKNTSNLQNTFQNIPKDRLLIETDSPFLAPEPFRGKKNEPSFLINTLNKLSDLLGLSTDEVSKMTTNNFNRLFFNS